MALLQDMRVDRRHQGDAKITKAMPMFAVSKRVRAQMAADSSRPYRSAWTRCSAMSRLRLRALIPRPGCCAAPAAIMCHLLVVCTANADCSARSSTSLVSALA